jgi:hypothetical protein
MTGMQNVGSSGQARTVTTADRNQYGGTGPSAMEDGGINSQGLCLTP